MVLFHAQHTSNWSGTNISMQSHTISTGFLWCQFELSCWFQIFLMLGHHTKLYNSKNKIDIQYLMHKSAVIFKLHRKQTQISM